MDDTPSKKTDIKTTVYHLLKAFPTAKYVAFNASLTSLNEDEWTNTWYIALFESAPYLKRLVDYYTWVANEDVNDPEDEEAIAFIHIVSDGFFLDDEPLQTSPSEWLSEEELCFTLNENDEVIQWFDESHLIESEEEETDPEAAVLDNLV